jgi:hypothetical protein
MNKESHPPKVVGGPVPPTPIPCTYSNHNPDASIYSDFETVDDFEDDGAYAEG